MWKLPEEIRSAPYTDLHGALRIDKSIEYRLPENRTIVYRITTPGRHGIAVSVNMDQTKAVVMNFWEPF